MGLAFLCFLFLVQAVQVAQIGNGPLGGSHIPTDFGNRLIQFGLPAAGNEYVGSLFHKALGGSKSDTRAAPVMLGFFPCSAFMICSFFRFELSELLQPSWLSCHSGHSIGCVITIVVTPNNGQITHPRRSAASQLEGTVSGEWYRRYRSHPNSVVGWKLIWAGLIVSE